MQFLKLWRYFIPLGLFAVIFIFLWRGLSIDPHTIPSPLMNQPVPQFALLNLTNEKIPFTTNNLRGQVSLVNVWATWCLTCRAEQPLLMDLARSHTVAIYGIDYKDDLTQAQQWLTQYGNPYRMLGFDADGKTSINLGVYGTPETFLVDKNGVIRYKLIGQLTPVVWQKQIMPMVKQLQNS